MGDAGRLFGKEPDPDDEHVVAAAVVGGAEVIVTMNLKDFPPNRLPPNIRAVAPAEFLHDTVATAPHLAARAVDEIAARSGRKGPAMDIDAVLTTLEQRYGCINAVAAIRAVGLGQPR